MGGGGSLIFLQLLNFSLWNILNTIQVLSLKVLVESVLDLADSSAEEGIHFGNLAPLGSNLLVHVKNELILFLGPLPSHNSWI